MIILKSTIELNNWFIENFNGLVENVGFVPTMGALHMGHASLIERAARECEIVVVSILVNPTQFNEKADLQSYPRTLENDVIVAEKAGGTILFTPTPEDIYGGTPCAEKVDYGPITSAFEGLSRQGHFDGVVSVVDKLFMAVRPNRAYFGTKDLQQVAVVERMSNERHPKIHIVSCKLIRDENGLALSSRNTRLSDAGIALAQNISQELQSVVDRVKDGLDVNDSVEIAKKKLKNLKGLELEYISGVNYKTFSISTENRGRSHIIIAASVEGIRLIDNIEL
jgi:pantoate--beta-alanine ligase|tara:strand:+ start:1581 stop:2423 length:843 start_codon:yes stop_codon:yes gene_type:complete